MVGVIVFMFLATESAEVWEQHSGHTTCRRHSERKFKGTGFSLAECQDFCLQDPHCGQIFGDLRDGVDTGACWTCPRPLDGQNTLPSPYSSFKAYTLKSAEGWHESSFHNTCGRHSERKFKGTGFSLAECKDFCVKDPNCGQIFGDLRDGVGNGACWTCPGPLAGQNTLAPSPIGSFKTWTIQCNTQELEIAACERAVVVSKPLKPNAEKAMTLGGGGKDFVRSWAGGCMWFNPEDHGSPNGQGFFGTSSGPAAYTPLTNACNPPNPPDPTPMPTPSPVPAPTPAPPRFYPRSQHYCKLPGSNPKDWFAGDTDCRSPGGSCFPSDSEGACKDECARDSACTAASFDSGRRWCQICKCWTCGFQGHGGWKTFIKLT